MNELSETKLARPLDKMAMANDAAALNSLCGFLNNPAITGADAPKVSGVSAVKPAAPAGPVVDRADPAVTRNPFEGTAVPEPAARRDLSKVFYTGRLCVGKDYIAAQTGAKIFGFADPLYAIANYFFGTKVSSTHGKDVNGMRAFLQTIGQWGWGCTEDSYPLTPARALFVQAIRTLGPVIDPDNLLKVDWQSFGSNPTIWIDAALARVAEHLGPNPTDHVATTNARFEREFKAMQAAGWAHYHVMSSPKTWAGRLALRKLRPDSPQLKDVSEKLSAHLDTDVTIKISRQRVGKRLNVIWNDTTPPPSPRLWTVREYLNEFGPVAGLNSVFTGE